MLGRSSRKRCSDIPAKTMLRELNPQEATGDDYGMQHPTDW